MPACDTHTEELAELERLATELVTLGFHADVRTHADRLPYLDVRNPRASVLGEKVYAQGGSYWWSWAERIARTEDVTKAAATLANVLRTVSGE
jgi:hypothetical protein